MTPRKQLFQRNTFGVRAGERPRQDPTALADWTRGRQNADRSDSARQKCFMSSPLIRCAESLARLAQLFAVIRYESSHPSPDRRSKYGSLVRRFRRLRQQQPVLALGVFDSFASYIEVAALAFDSGERKAKLNTCDPGAGASHKWI